MEWNGMECYGMVCMCIHTHTYIYICTYSYIHINTYCKGMLARGATMPPDMVRWWIMMVRTFSMWFLRAIDIIDLTHRWRPWAGRAPVADTSSAGKTFQRFFSEIIWIWFRYDGKIIWGYRIWWNISPTLWYLSTQIHMGSSKTCELRVPWGFGWSYSPIHMSWSGNGVYDIPKT